MHVSGRLAEMASGSRVLAMLLHRCSAASLPTSRVPLHRALHTMRSPVPCSVACAATCERPLAWMDVAAWAVPSRSMSIMSHLKRGGLIADLEELKRLAARGAAPDQSASSDGTDEPRLEGGDVIETQAGDGPAEDAGDSSITAAPSTSLSSADESVTRTSLAPRPDAALSTDSTHTSREQFVKQALKLLSRERDDHVSRMCVIESTPEWAAYDAHLSFEMLRLRVSYAAAMKDSAVPPAQMRAQMQAHLRGVQRSVMHTHAEEVADAFVRALTPAEVDALRKQLLPLDADVTPGSAARGASTAATSEDSHTRTHACVTPEELRTALKELSQLLRTHGVPTTHADDANDTSAPKGSSS